MQNRSGQSHESRLLLKKKLYKKFKLSIITSVKPEVMYGEHGLVSSTSIVSPYDTTCMPPVDEFVFKPAPLYTQIQCRIIRDRSGTENRSYPVYYLHLETEEQKRMRKIFLLGARKRKKTTTSSYIISTDPVDMSKESDYFVAKLHMNMMGTRFDRTE